MLDLFGPSVYGITGGIGLVLGLAQLGLKAFVMIDVVLRKAQVFPAADKQTKNFWLIILGLALVAALVSAPLGLLAILGTIAALVYLLDARPAVAQIDPKRGRSNGPYGPW